MVKRTYYDAFSAFGRSVHNNTSASCFYCVHYKPYIIILFTVRELTIIINELHVQSGSFSMFSRSHTYYSRVFTCNNI